jgi:hypothetical protein
MDRRALRFAVAIAIASTAFGAASLRASGAPKGALAAKKKPTGPSSAAPAASAEPEAPAEAPAPSIAPAAPASASATAPVSPLTPRPDETPPVRAAPGTKPPNYDELMAEIAALRARVAVVGNAVWKSRLAVTLRLRGGHARITAAKLALDGAQIWVAPKGFLAEDDVAIFEGGVSPGPHAITLEVERRDDRDETFRTIDRTTATVVVPNGKTLGVEVRAEDDSTMGEAFPSDGDGRYRLRLEIRAKAGR